MSGKRKIQIMNVPVSRRKLTKAALGIVCLGSAGLLAFKVKSPAQPPPSLSSAPAPPEMDSLADYRLLAQGAIEHDKYLLFEKAYRHWSQLAVIYRSKSAGPYSEKIVDVPLGKREELLHKNKMSSSRHKIRFSESILVRKTNTFLIRMTFVFDDDKDVELLADYQPGQHRLTLRENTWKVCKPGEPITKLSDE